MYRSRLLASALAIGTFALCAATAPAQIRVATYNIAADVNGVTTANPGFDTVVEGIGSESVNGFARPLDILGLEEVTSNSATVAPIVTTLNNFYGPGTYAMGTFNGAVNGGNPTSGNGPNALVYNTHTLQLIANVGVGTVSTSGAARQEIRYQFRPVGYGSSADFYVYVGHYKASSGATNEDRRDVEAQIVRANAATLPAGSRILYLADFNLTSGTSEAAWSTLTSAGTGTMTSGQAIDPINLGGGSWNNSNASFRGAYSEATDSISARFDMQLNTPATMSGHGFSYISGSHHVFGNNGSTPLNGAANSGSNTALAGMPNRSAILNALTTSSDHYPAVADYRLPAKMAVNVAAVPSQVIVGASVPVNVTVTNAAPVLAAIGADGLNYTVSSAGAVSGSASGTNLAALSPGNTHMLSLATGAPGVSSGTVSANSSSVGVASGSFAQGVSTTVLAHANASFSGSSDDNSATIDFGIIARGMTPPPIPFSVNNLADASGFTARLDLDSINGSGDVTKLSTNAAPFSNLIAGAAQSFAASLDAASTGSFSALYTLNVSDENLPGAISLAPMSLTILGRVAIGGDANLDGTVDTTDFNILASDFGAQSQTWVGGDFNGDGSVDTTDFNILASNFGQSEAASLASTFVPEPASMLAIAGLALLFQRRRSY